MPTDPTDLELDEDAIDLPPLPAVGGSEELGLGDEELDAIGVDGPEEVGLDDAEGLDDFDPVAFLDAPPEASGDLLDDATGADDDLGLGEAFEEAEGEYGWTDDAEADAALFADDDLIDLPATGTPVGDEELGPGDDAGLLFDDEDALAGLPPLAPESDADEDAEDLDLGGEADIAWAGEVGREARSTSQARVVVRGKVNALAGDAREIWLVGERLWRVRSGQPRDVSARGLEAEEPVWVDLDPRNRALVVGTRGGGLFRSTDGGESFEPLDTTGAEGRGTGGRFAFDRWGRLWRWAGGRLHLSDDTGESWRAVELPWPILDATVGGGRLVVMLVAGERLELRRGARTSTLFTAAAPPCPRPGLPLRLVADEERLAVFAAAEGGAPWVYDGARWTRETHLEGAHLGAFVGGTLVGAVYDSSRGDSRVTSADGVVADLRQLFGAASPDDGRRRVRALRCVDEELWVASGLGVVSVPL